MPANEQQIHTPTVLWAQRDDKVFLTVAVEDIDKPEIKVEDNTLYFKGTSKQGTYELNIELFKPLNKAECKYGIYGQKHWMFILKKQEKGPYWPRLLKDNKKNHWIKADWNKWKDEDEEDENDDGGMGNGDFNSMFQQMGGLGGMGGMGGMGGLGGLGGMDDGMPDLNDLEDKGETDSDDEKLPDLEENKPTEEKKE